MDQLTDGGAPLRHVLVIEDEWLVALDLEYVLREMGVTSVAVAASETEAVAEAARSRPGLILADFQLAGGTGLEAVRCIRRQWGQVPVVYVTGTPEALQGETDQIIAKPFTKAVLRRACATALGRAPQHLDA
jgi:CheY-like chemotaxis protein